MAEQVCPHCDKVITDQDLASYHLKLKERQYRKDFLTSSIRRRHNYLFGIILALGIMGTIFPIFVAMIDANVEKYFKVWLGVEIIFGIFSFIWIIYSRRQEHRLENEYVKSRLAESA